MLHHRWMDNIFFIAVETISINKFMSKKNGIMRTVYIERERGFRIIPFTVSLSDYGSRKNREGGKSRGKEDRRKEGDTRVGGE